VKLLSTAQQVASQEGLSSVELVEVSVRSSCTNWAGKGTHRLLVMETVVQAFFVLGIQGGYI
jgi:hypothetical protein